MGRPDGTTGRSFCEVCPRADRKEIDAAIRSSLPLREIASRHPGTSKSALGRHRKKCVAGAIIRAVARVVSPPPDMREIEAYEDSLLAEMRGLQSRTLKLLDDAEAAQDGRLRAVAISQVRENVVALAKLMPSSTRGADVAVMFNFGELRPRTLAAPAEAATEGPDAPEEGDE